MSEKVYDIGEFASFERIDESTESVFILRCPTRYADLIGHMINEIQITDHDVAEFTS